MNLLDTLFPRVCMACQNPLEGGDFCPDCRRLLQLNMQPRCMVCSLDQMECKLCKDRSYRPRPSWILTALKPTVQARKFVQSAYGLRGWRAHLPIFDMIWARYLISCVRKPTKIIALPNPNGYFGFSGSHRWLANRISQRLEIPHFSFNQARVLSLAKQENLLFVGWSSSMDWLITQLNQPPWQRAITVGVLVALLESCEGSSGYSSL